MKTKSLVMIGISLVFGLVAAVGMSQVMGRPTGNNEPREQTIEVLVAKDDVNIGDKLTPEKVVLKKFPVSLAPEGAIRSMDDLENRVARARILKNAALLFDVNTCPKDQLIRLDIPKGFRLTSIGATKEDTIHHQLRPGNIVDLLGIFRHPTTNEQYVKTFLKNIKIFGIDAKSSRSTEEETSKISTINLLVTPKQAELIELAKTIGRVRLIFKADSLADLSEKDRGGPIDFNYSGGETDMNSLLGVANNGEDNVKQFVEQAMASNTSTGKAAFRMKVVGGSGPVMYDWSDRNELPTVSTGDVAPVADTVTDGEAGEAGGDLDDFSNSVEESEPAADLQ